MLLIGSSSLKFLYGTFYAYNISGWKFTLDPSWLPSPPLAMHALPVEPMAIYMQPMPATSIFPIEKNRSPAHNQIRGAAGRNILKILGKGSKECSSPRKRSPCTPWWRMEILKLACSGRESCPATPGRGRKIFLPRSGVRRQSIVLHIHGRISAFLCK